MENEFIPYEQALALAKLGFDEPCIGWYNPQVNYKEVTTDKYWAFYLTGEWENFKPAPLYQQAFRFFREKHNLVHEISWSKYKGGLNFDYDVFSLVLPTDDELGDEDDIASDKSMETYDSLVDKGFKYIESDTYEEAELTCLNKLIEIIKTK